MFTAPTRSPDAKYGGVATAPSCQPYLSAILFVSSEPLSNTVAFYADGVNEEDDRNTVANVFCYHPKIMKNASKQIGSRERTFNQPTPP
jgi:hypothetical protein